MNIVKPDAATKCKALVFGPGGHGKTYFLGTADDDPRTSPTLFLAWEAGLHTLVGRDIDTVIINDWTEYNEAYEELARPDSAYRSVCVDSLSETQTGGLLNLLSTPNPNRVNTDSLERGDWGVILIQMRRFVREFKTLGMHVFMSALSKSDTDPREGRIITPSFSGQFADEVIGMFDVVGYMAEVTEGEHFERQLLLHHPKYRVKARTPMGIVAPDEIVDPDVTKLLDALGYPNEGE